LSFRITATNTHTTEQVGVSYFGTPGTE